MIKINLYSSILINDQDSTYWVMQRLKLYKFLVVVVLYNTWPGTVDVTPYVTMNLHKWWWRLPVLMTVMQCLMQVHSFCYLSHCHTSSSTGNSPQYIENAHNPLKMQNVRNNQWETPSSVDFLLSHCDVQIISLMRVQVIAVWLTWKATVLLFC